MATTSAHAADGGGLRHSGADLSLRRGRAVREDLIVDALKSAATGEGGAAAGSTERIIGYKVRKYGIDPGASAGADGGAHASALEVGGR